MDNYREKIIRIVERELKRTEEYQQRRDEYGNEEYILGCIMVKGDAFPKEVIAHAFVEDMGLELQFQIWRDEPRVRQMQAMWYDLTLFDVEGDFFGKLEQGYSILSVSDLFHCTAWSATGYLADEQSRDKAPSGRCIKRGGWKQRRFPHLIRRYAAVHSTKARLLPLE